MEYFFHVLDGNRSILDEQGMHLRNIQEARREMRATAHDILHQTFEDGLDVGSVVVEVADLDGRVKARMFLREIFN